MLKTRFSDLHLYQKLKEYLNKLALGYFIVEVLVIVVGLTVSFMIDEWRQEQKQREQEIHILYSIAEDLKADSKFASRRIERVGEGIVIAKRLLDTEYASSVHRDSLQNWFRSLQQFNGFMPNNNTYKTISADARTVISNARLRKKLQSYYSMDYGFAYDWEDYERKLVSKRREYMLTKLNSSGLTTMQRSRRKQQLQYIVLVYDRPSMIKALSDPIFQSLIRVSIAAKQETINFAKMRLKSIDELQSQLDITFENSSEIYASVVSKNEKVKAGDKKKDPTKIKKNEQVKPRDKKKKSTKTSNNKKVKPRDKT